MLQGDFSFNSQITAQNFIFFSLVLYFSVPRVYNITVDISPALIIHETGRKIKDSGVIYGRIRE